MKKLKKYIIRIVKIFPKILIGDIYIVKMNNVCEFCNSNESELYIKSDLVSYNKCLNCGLIYQFPVITQKEINAIYDDNYFE